MKTENFQDTKKSKIFGVQEIQKISEYAKNRRFLCMTRKAQTEIIGLAIVVILLVIGMTFVIRFSLSKDFVDIKSEFYSSELASNWPNTFLNTKSENCNELSMTELLQDCGHGKSISCNGQISCDYVEETAIKIFGDTLDVWKVDYEFKVFRTENDPLITVGNPCPGTQKSKTFPIPTSSGTLFVRLDVCQ